MERILEADEATIYRPLRMTLRMYWEPPFSPPYEERGADWLVLLGGLAGEEVWVVCSGLKGPLPWKTLGPCVNFRLFITFDYDRRD
jgi:hypothetical protein